MKDVKNAVLADLKDKPAASRNNGGQAGRINRRVFLSNSLTAVLASPLAARSFAFRPAGSSLIAEVEHLRRTRMPKTSRSGYVQTVLGPIEPRELGVTFTHEHVLSDLSPLETPPAEASLRALYYKPLSMEVLGYINHYYGKNADDLRLDDIDTAIAELGLYRQHGGGAVVEASSVGLSRDPLGLARVSRASGVHIVMGSSYYVGASHPPNMDRRTEDELAEEIVRDIAEGVGDTSVKAGIIGEVGCSWPLTPNERKVLRASARAQRRMGAAVLIHPGRDPASPEQILDALEEAGGDLTRTIIGHLDRTVVERPLLQRIAERGCYLEWDHFGFERSYYPPNPKIEIPSHRGRIDLIAFVTSKGYGDKVLVAHDVASKRRLVKYGGHGYFFILRQIVPRMKERGFSQDDIDRILVRNPAAALTLAG